MYCEGHGAHGEKVEKLSSFYGIFGFPLFRLKDAGGFEEGRGVLGRNHQVVDWTGW